MGELECVRNVEYSEDSYLGFYLRRDTFFFFFVIALISIWIGTLE